MKKLFIALSLVASFSANAEWTAIGFIDNKPRVGIDASRSFPSSGGIMNVWWKEYWYDLTPVGRPGYHPMYIYRSKIDCRTRMMQNDYALSVEVKSFYDTNPVQYESARHGPFQWFVPNINSSNEFIVNYYCNK